MPITESRDYRRMTMTTVLSW